MNQLWSDHPPEIIKCHPNRLIVVPALNSISRFLERFDSQWVGTLKMLVLSSGV